MLEEDQTNGKTFPDALYHNDKMVSRNSLILNPISEDCGACSGLRQMTSKFQDAPHKCGVGTSIISNSHMVPYHIVIICDSCLLWQC